MIMAVSHCQVVMFAMASGQREEMLCASCQCQSHMRGVVTRSRFARRVSKDEDGGVLLLPDGSFRMISVALLASGAGLRSRVGLTSEM